MKKIKSRTLLTKYDVTGLLFVLPFILGFIFLFARPLAESLKYTFNKITVGTDGLQFEYVGLQYYNEVFFVQQDFLKSLVDVCGQLLIKICVIMFVSMFLAILLNEKFPARLMFRTLLFLPVIFGADQIMSMFSGLGGGEALTEDTNDFVMMAGEMTGFVKEIISSFGILTPVIEKFTVYANSLFNLLWDMGLQIVLFIIGLQAIPSYLYEVAEMEGATKWETFWKITFPLLTPSILLCLIFSVIDYFNSSSNAIVGLITKSMLGNIGYATTQSWIYAIFVFVIVLIINAIVSRKVINLD